MTRVPEVIDCWFDSGAMPFAQWHYPFENKEIFERRFPAQFISEALDQTRGWFYSLLAISTLLFDQTPFQNVIVMGFVLDKYGQKMSKHKGNVINPQDILEKEGADAVRWYFYANSQPWLPSRFSAEAVNELKRKFMGTLWNTYAFYILYADIDQFDPTKYSFVDEELSLMDRWVLSRLNSATADITKRLDHYDITGASRALQNFVEELSNWYVRGSRERYWESGMEQDKIHAFLTLYHVLETLCRLAAPFTPFMAETIYQNLVRSVDQNAPESVHFLSWPDIDSDRIDVELEEQMDLVLEIVNLGRAARNNASLKIRQPLAAMYVAAGDRTLDQGLVQLVLDELNIKRLSWVTDADDLQDYSFKPQLRLLGRKLGKQLPAVSEALRELDGQKAMAELKANNVLTVTADGTTFELTEEELIIETAQPEGLATESNRGIVVALDTVLTPELIEEGFVREIVSKVQTMRKDSGFDVTDRITLYYGGNKKLEQLIVNRKASIADDVLAEDVTPLTPDVSDTVREWNINGETLQLAVKRMLT